MFQVLLIITIALILLYSLLILLYRRWFLEITPFVATEDQLALTSFSIIIPARNEANNIYDCVLSILNQSYPKELFEVIVVDDYSTDDTAKIVQALQLANSNLHLICLEEYLKGTTLNAYKKKAIEIAIAQSKSEWIITTDADCIAKKEWLTQYDSFIQNNNYVFIAAPVMLFKGNSFLAIFQMLDFISLQGITAASVTAGTHAMCNGANLAYEKTAFYEVEQFQGIDNLASGDDMLLMQKIKVRYPGKLGYLFNQKAIIETAAMPDWNSFLNQRIRWASKASGYKDRTIFWVLLLVYLLNLFLLAIGIASFFVEGGFNTFLILLLIKTLVEISFMYPVGKFFGLTEAITWFPIMQPFHIIYTVIAGWLGKFGSYQWKGRKLH